MKRNEEGNSQEADNSDYELENQQENKDVGQGADNMMQQDDLDQFYDVNEGEDLEIS